MLNWAEDYYVTFPQVYAPPVSKEIELLAKLLSGLESTITVGHKGGCYKAYINMSVQYAVQVVVLEVGYPKNRFRCSLQCPNSKVYIMDSAKALWRYIKTLDMKSTDFYK